MFTLDELTDKYIGEKGSVEKRQFEFELELDIFGLIIRQARLEQHLTLEELGKLVGVQKAQISKIAARHL
ncbi:MAG: helix-turn-helix transcriptional regulator [Bacteroidales bacterium]|jgi:hypothetical protein|nr:helix-turn-helix transcriptional regulator [Bacteroidales bacterium]